MDGFLSDVFSEIKGKYGLGVSIASVFFAALVSLIIHLNVGDVTTTVLVGIAVLCGCILTINTVVVIVKRISRWRSHQRLEQLRHKRFEQTKSLLADIPVIEFGALLARELNDREMDPFGTRPSKCAELGIAVRQSVRSTYGLQAHDFVFSDNAIEFLHTNFGDALVQACREHLESVYVRLRMPRGSKLIGGTTKLADERSRLMKDLYPRVEEIVAKRHLMHSVGGMDAPADPPGS